MPHANLRTTCQHLFQYMYDLLVHVTPHTGASVSFTPNLLPITQPHTDKDFEMSSVIMKKKNILQPHFNCTKLAVHVIEIPEDWHNLGSLFIYSHIHFSCHIKAVDVTVELVVSLFRGRRFEPRPHCPLAEVSLSWTLNIQTTLGTVLPVRK